MNSGSVSLKDKSPSPFTFQRFVPRVLCDNRIQSVPPPSHGRRHLTEVEYAATMALIEWCRRVVGRSKSASSPKRTLHSSRSSLEDAKNVHPSVATAVGTSLEEPHAGVHEEGMAGERGCPHSSRASPSLHRLSDATPLNDIPTSSTSFASPLVPLLLPVFEVLARRKESSCAGMEPSQPIGSAVESTGSSLVEKKGDSQENPLHRPGREEAVVRGSRPSSPLCDGGGDPEQISAPQETPLVETPCAALPSLSPVLGPMHRYAHAKERLSSPLLDHTDALPARNDAQEGGRCHPSSASHAIERRGSQPVEGTSEGPPSHTVTEGDTLLALYAPPSSSSDAAPNSPVGWREEEEEAKDTFPFLPPLVSPHEVQEMRYLLQQGGDVWYPFPPLNGEGVGAYIRSSSLRPSEKHPPPIADRPASPHSRKEGPSTHIPETVLHVLAKHGLVEAFEMCLVESVHPISMVYASPTDPIPLPFSLCEYLLPTPVATALFRLVVHRLVRCPTTTCVDWAQPLGGSDFLAWMASYQRVSQFWPLVKGLPFFADKIQKKERLVIRVPVWRWDLEALIAAEDVREPVVVREGKERILENSPPNAGASEEEEEGEGTQGMPHRTGKKKDVVWSSRPGEASVALRQETSEAHHKIPSSSKKAFVTTSEATVMESSGEGVVVVGGLEFRGEVIEAEKITADFVKIGQAKGWNVRKEMVQFYVQKGVDIFFRSPFMERSIIEEFLLRNHREGVVELLNTAQALDFNRILDLESGNSLLHLLAKERLFHTDVVCGVIQKILCRVNEKPYYDTISWGRRNAKGEHFLSFAAHTKRLAAFWKLVKGITYFIYVRKPIHLSYAVDKEDWNALGDTAPFVFALDAGFQVAAATAPSSSLTSFSSPLSSQLRIKPAERFAERNRKKMANIRSFSSFPLLAQKRMTLSSPLAQCSTKMKLWSASSSSPERSINEHQMRNSSTGSSRRHKPSVVTTKSVTPEKERSQQRRISSFHR